MAKRPYILGGLALGVGCCWAFFWPNAGIRVSRELMAFHRKEQMAKLRAILVSLLTFERVDTFTALPEQAFVAPNPIALPCQTGQESCELAESKAR